MSDGNKLQIQKITLSFLVSDTGLTNEELAEKLKTQKLSDIMGDIAHLVLEFGPYVGLGIEVEDEEN